MTVDDGSVSFDGGGLVERTQVAAVGADAVPAGARAETWCRRCCASPSAVEPDRGLSTGRYLRTDGGERFLSWRRCCGSEQPLASCPSSRPGGHRSAAGRNGTRLADVGRTAPPATRSTGTALLRGSSGDEIAAVLGCSARHRTGSMPRRLARLRVGLPAHERSTEMKDDELAICARNLCRQRSE